MNSSVDFEIYKSIKQNIRLTEIYLGSAPVSWPYAVITYKADCTEAFPFTPFDKAICSILEIDGTLSFEEIAEILGFNVINDPAENKYRDQAEYEILFDSLTSLYDFEMIEKGDNFFSKCSLTKIGKEYTSQKTKFKTTENKSFELYFDIFSKNHSKAKSIFQDLKGTYISTFPSDIDFSDETYIKTFAQSQVPDVFNIETGNSFANSSILDSDFFAVQLQIGFTFDFQLNKFNAVAHCPQSNTTYFTDAINSNEDIKEVFLEQFLSKLNQTDSVKSEDQLNFEENTIAFQNDVDYLIYQQKHTEALDKIKSFFHQSLYFDITAWWFKLDNLITEQTKEVALLLTDLNTFDLEKIIGCSSKFRNTNFFIALDSFNNIPLEISSKFCKAASESPNLFLVTDVKLPYFSAYIINSDHIFEYTALEYIFKYIDTLFSTTVLHRNSGGELILNKYNNVKKAFTNRLVGPILTECETDLSKEITEFNSTAFQSLQNIDIKLSPFIGHASPELKPRIENILSLKKEKITAFKSQHQSKLIALLNSIKDSHNLEQFEKTESVDLIFSELLKIESELLPDYSELKDLLSTYKKALTETKEYIKDQLLAKHYVIDTNIFVDSPDILSRIDKKHNIILSAKVLDELDNLKRKLLPPEKKGNIEKALSLINKSIGKQKNIRTAKSNLNLLPKDFNEKSPDNFILAVAIMYKEKNVVLFTSDNGLQAKAKTLDISTVSLAEFNDSEKYKVLYSLKGFPVSQKTNKPLNIIAIVKAYEKGINPLTGKLTLASFNEVLSKSIIDFSFKEFGFHKFKDFCSALSEVFEIVYDEKGTAFIKLKLKL